mgnify:CR=1 FL=1
MRRAAHGVGFEGGLVGRRVPFCAWWLEVSLWQTFVLDLGLLLFLRVCTVVFKRAFDKGFGQPASALPVEPSKPFPMAAQRSHQQRGFPSTGAKAVTLFPARARAFTFSATAAIMPSLVVQG